MLSAERLYGKTLTPCRGSAILQLGRLYLVAMSGFSRKWGAQRGQQVPLGSSGWCLLTKLRRLDSKEIFPESSAHCQASPTPSRGHTAVLRGVGQYHGQRRLHELTTHVHVVQE